MRLALPLLLLAAMPPLLAPLAAAPAPARKAPAWVSDWGERHCTLSRKMEAPGAPTLALRVVPGTENVELILIGDDVFDLNADKLWVALTPGDTKAEATVERGQAAGERFLKLTGLGRRDLKFLAAFAQAKEMRVERGEKLLALPIPKAARAVAALQECIDARLTAWGVEPKALASLREKPRLPDGKMWLGADDYPDAAIRQSLSGAVIVRLATDVQGKVTECAVVSTSGSAALDQTTCRRALERGRYKPAVGGDGAPVPAAFIHVVRWSLETD